MANYNKVILVGNLTRDIQLSYLPSKMPVADFGLAVNRRWKPKEGDAREETCFVDCVAFGKQADTLNKYVSKGSPILVEGRLQLDTWDAKDGTKRSKHKVVVENFQFLGGKEDRPAASKQVAPAEPIPDTYDADKPDDIPF